MLETIKVDALKISKNRIEILNKLGIYTIEDLITFYPYRYDNVESQMPTLENPKIVAQATIITQPKIFYIKRNLTRITFEVSIQDRPYKVVIFNRQFIMQHLQLGKEVVIIGKCDLGKYNIVASDIKLKTMEEASKFYPIYSQVEGISGKTILNYINKALEIYKDKIHDFIPEEYIEKYHLIHRYQALYYIHNPRNSNDLKHALRHLKYEEFLKFQLVMQFIKQQYHQVKVGVKKNFLQQDIQSFINDLSFALTKDQMTSVEEILNDLQSDHLMYRLLQGDVGSGKTVVASIGLYANYLAGFQGALMAPTEILAKQHYLSLKKLFKNTKVNIELLTGSLSIGQKKDVYARLENHEIDVIVGTHALIQEKVIFDNLGFVIADEQHRFGVNQRKILKDKGKKTDFLLMSATPIPRTLAISLFGDMDVSTIKTMPVGRKQVITKYLKTKTMKPILNDLKEYLSVGGQCYVVCPLIEESEVLSSRNATSIYESMKKYFMNQYEVGLLHGKMNDEEKENIMNQFRDNQIQILVSTTVIEVGVDVSNANMMVIYDAERFGLSQLHQLRGRIGRGNQEGYCFVLSNSDTLEAKQRLEFLASTTDGFEISNYDLKLRGPGEVLGQRQSGIPVFLLVDIFEDFNILEVARKDAKEIIENQFKSNKYQNIKTYIYEKISENIEYIG